jgi:uncharacterized membrane protein
METRLKLLGHPVHPMLIVFPLGLLATAVIFDVLYWATGNGDLATFSYWAIPAGLIGGLAAALFGLIDLLAIPGDTRAKRVALFHGGGNVVVLALFATSFVARSGSAQYLPNPAPLVLGLLGAGLALVTAWLGAELVFRLRVGVANEAGLNAPNSLAVSGPLQVEARSERLRRG